MEESNFLRVKNNFKDLFFENRSTIVNELTINYNNYNKNGFLIAPFFYEEKEGGVFINEIFLKRTIEQYYSSSSYFIIYYDLIYKGGYQSINVSNSAVSIDEHKWNSYINKLKGIFFDKEENNNYLTFFNDLSFFQNRLPKNKKEEILFNGVSLNIEGEVVLKKYMFFDKKNIKKAIEYMLSICFPDFKYEKKLSNSKIKKYIKSIGCDINIILSIDFGSIMKELDNTYIEVPKIEIEICDNNLCSYVKQEEYLNSESEVDIFRVGFNYFMGNPNLFRIGNSSQDEAEIKKDYLFYTLNYFYSVDIQLNILEKIIKGFR